MNILHPRSLFASVRKCFAQSGLRKVFPLALPPSARLATRFGALIVVLSSASHLSAQTTDGPLQMDVITAYNFVVDSNVESPSSFSPSAAHLGVKVCNTGATSLTDVEVSIGNLIDPPTSSGTPGVFASRTVTVTGAKGYSGTFALEMPGGSVDAVRTIPSLGPGECVVQYFFVTYPLKDPAGNAVTGAAPDPSDDLWLNYDIWAKAEEGATTRRVSDRTKVTMRSEISAMANKIWPNTTSKVPAKYLDAIEQSLGWRPDTTAPQAGATAQMEGIWYDLGNVGAGFDNDGDGLPDRNAWMQPVGDPSAYDPLCMRLVKCYGIVIVKLNNGTEQLIPFEDRLYFEQISEKNTGAVGLVFYEFVPLASGCRASLSPYQEVASGNDNEKFNGDYGASSGGFTSSPPSMNFDKSGPDFVAAGGTASYSLTAENTGTTGIGLPGLSLPFVFEDAIPSGLVYVAGSATAANTIPAGNSVMVWWSTDNGATWVSTEPSAASVTRVRWTLGAALAPGTTATVGFQATVPLGYSSVSVENTGIVRLGSTGSIASSTVTSRLTGSNSIGDLVWKDTNRDSIKDAGESGIPNITVSLYYDTNGNGALDPSEPLYGTTATDGSGLYSFGSLPDGNYIVEVDDSDAQLPAGSILPNAIGTSFAVNLDAARVVATPVDFLNADWPFIDALVIAKTTSPTTYGAGSLVTYVIDLENRAAPVAPKTTPVRTGWATTVTGTRAAQNPANAQGAPDANYARVDFQGNSDTLTTSGGITYPSPTGTISKVELVFNAYLSQALTDDRMDVSVNGTLFSTLTTVQLNTLLGPAKIYAVDVTSLNGTWSWAQVQALTAELKANKTSQADTGIVWVDSIGYRVTTVAVPPPAGSYGLATIDPLPLTDTFDPARLAYVSSSLPPTSVSGGTITWANAGPLNPGGRRSITVVFRALTTPTVVNTTNTASSSGAGFVSGQPANSATSNIAITINPRGEIGDFVFWDLNGNGSFDGGEPGIPNVLVTLDNGAQTRTDANGFYIFRNLADGTYTVTVDPATLPWTTFSQTVDPDGAVKDNASTVTINNSNGPTTDDGYLDRDFGYDSTSNVISGVLFEDDNGNGVKDAGEVFLSGVTVTLSGASSGSVITDSSGFYQFGSLADGTYTVTVTPPGGTTQTLDPDATLNNATTVVASGGNLYANRDFAYQPTGAFSIGDTVYYDWNGNGTQDAGEGGIADIDVILYRDTNGDGAIDELSDPQVSTTFTDANGGYGFGALPAGDYLVVVDTSDPEFPSGVLQIEDYDGVRDSMAVVDLTADLLTVDFGYEPRGTASIGDTVFLDTNGDGLKDGSEAGIANVTVTLYADTNNNGVIDAGIDAVVGATTTGSDGGYLFSGLREGDYLVDVDQNAASIPSDALGNKYRLTTTDPHDVTLLAGETYTAADFGFAAPAAIGDFVFFDSNGNGTQDLSETGIANVTVELYLDADQDGVPDSPTPIATTITADGLGSDPAGFYQFANLAAGTYYVKVLTSSLPQSGGLPIPQTSDPDRDGVPVGDNTYPGLPAGDDADSLVIVSLGSNYLGADFGYQPSGALGDFVWLDLNQDGIQDPGEPGVANVAVRISDGITTYDVLTDFDGYWSVANIPDGAWTVSILPSNFTLGEPLENTVNTHDADGGADSSVDIVLTNGTVDLPAGNLGLDFGYALDGSYAVSGTVLTHDTRVVGTADDPDDFYDDGVDQDAGPDDEIELGGLVVYLYTTSGTFLGSTVTDGNGNYSFSGLPPGDYRVIMGTTTPELHNSTLTTTAANNAAVTSVDATSGTSVIQTLTIGGNDVTNVDFAFLSDTEYDYGDLPLSYASTTLSQDGARHIIPPGGSTLYLGTAPDPDTNGIPTALADGDDVIGSDDEDGVVPLSPTSWTDGEVTGGDGGSLQVNVTGSGWLVGWIDWNGDGDFLDADEMVASQAVTTGSSAISFDIPIGTIGAASASWLSRFRLFPSEPAYPLFSYTGTATDGEVEDHLIEKPVGASIGDLVWNDSNGNGILDSGEDGLGGLTVELRDGIGTLVETQITGDGTFDVDGDGVIDPAGYYRFRELAADTYTVTVSTPPAGFAPSFDEDGIGTAHVTGVNLASGEQHLGADFGYAPLLADISGQVRYDADADGDFNDPDSGAMVVRIQLWSDPNGDGDPSDGVQVGETFTDATGNYMFTDVPSGDYVVVEVNPAGTTSTADVEGANDDRIAVVLTGSDVTGRDFLDTQPPVYDVSGTVYLDNSGTNDNVIGVDDTPVASIVVNLFLDRDLDGVVSAGDTLLGSTVTDVNGDYTFSGLPAGPYVIQEIDPSGASSDWDAQGSPTDNQIGVSVIDADITGRDFLDDGIVTSTISGQVTDGTNPIPGVTITLKDGSGNVIATAVTDTNGNYSFPNLPDGNYTVEETNPPGTTGGSDADGPGNGDDTIAVTLAGGAGSTGNDFVDLGSSLATISGSVFNDGPLDSNVIDGDDSPIAGVTLTLYQDSNGNGLVDAGEPLLGTAVTSSDGSYAFNNLPDGNYVVVETNPTGVTSDDFDAQGALDDNTIGVSLAGVDSTGDDFLDDGLATHTVGGQVTDGADPIPGVIITLKDANGAVIGTAITDSNGDYSFPNLPAGNYTIEETNPAGTIGGSDADGGDPDLITITGLAGDSLDNDFVDTGATLATIGGVVYNDTGDDDLLDGSGESPVAGVTVSLYKDVDTDGIYTPGTDVLIGTVVTGLDGSYAFSNLPDGEYLVVETDPATATSDTDADGTGTNGANTVAVSLGGVDDLDNDFLDDMNTATIAGNSYADTGGDDTLNGSGESPIGGTVITLYTDPNGDGDPSDGVVVAVTVTGTDGSYRFDNVAPGDYVVVETQPSGFALSDDDTSTLIADGTDNWIDVNLNGSGFPRGGNNFLNDGGTLYQLGGSVLNDTGDDDVLDGNGETPLGGVALTLYKDLNGNGVLEGGEPVIDTAITGSDGSYSFGNLPPGDYLVVESDPSGAVSDDDTQGDGTDNTVATAIVAGDSTGNDFLDDSVLTAPISGSVYADTGGDDTLDGSGETPIAGVTLALYSDPNGDGNPSDGVVIGTAVTGADGSYLFENMVPGDYVVAETNPGGFTVSDDDTSTLIADGTDNWVDVNLDGTGTPSTGNDFLDDGGALFTVGGQVTDGTNPIPGVTITLKDGNGAVIGTAITDSNGDYSFPNLPAGNYTIEETNPAGTTGGSDSDGGAPDLITITGLAADSLDNDFVDTGASLATIGGVVYNDTGDDDILDGNGESPVAGVTVSLYKDVDTDGIYTPGTDVLIGTAVTGSDGSYAFSNLPDGEYLVVETDPATATSDTDADGTGLNGANTVAVTLAGVDDLDNDFLDDMNTATIAGYSYADTGGDDVLNGSGESPIGGTVITLYTDPNGDGDPSDGVAVAVTVTGTDGSYRFDNLAPGDYVVVETQPSGFGTSDDDTSTLIADGTDNWVDVNLNGSGFPRGGNNFLNDGGSLYQLGGSVLADTGGDDTLDGNGESPLGGVQVSLYKDLNGNGVLDPGEPLIGTSITGSDGSYLFGNLLPGDYLVVETDPSGAVSDDDTQGDGTDNTVATSIASADSTGNNFLDDGVTTYTVAGQVSDGTDPIPGVTVTLKDGSGNFIDTAVTDSNGDYSFPNLTAGNYTVEETDPVGTSGGSDKDGGDPNLITITGLAADSLDNDFVDTGFTRESISGTVYNDTTENNVIDPGSDTPIGGVVFTLVSDTNGNGLADPGEPVIATTVSSVDGSYSFNGLPQGNYVVVETDPSGAVSENDTDGSPTDNNVGVILSGIGDSTGNDFLDDGVVTSAISGQVTDGTNPIPGVTITLKDGSGNVIATTVTDTSGNYSFPNLPDGSYTVEETNPAGTTGGSDADGPGNGDDTIAVTLSGGGGSTGNDFVDTGSSLATLSGTVYDDGPLDSNVIDGDDTPIAGVELTLYQDSNGNGLVDPGEPVGTTVTDTNGEYSFANLPDGDYVVVETNPAGVTSDDFDTQGAPNDNTIGVSLAGVDSPGNDFLDDGLTTYTVAGRVSDGTDPIPGVTITLKGAGGNVIDTAVTDSNGDYSFPNLPAGNYTIEETDPVGTSGGSDKDGGDPNLITITGLAADSLDNDFVDTGASLATIGGVVYNDTGDDNILDGNGESPVAGVTVSLYKDVDSDGIYTPGTDVLIGTGVTGSDGSYAFPNLPDGQYLVVETDPATATSDTDADGTGVNGANTVAVVLTGIDDLNNDFLDDMNTATIAGYSYADTGGDDVLNGSGESPIGGTVITLYTDPNGDGDPSDGVVVAVTATGTDGSYRFDNVAPGDYVVVETQPPGFALSDDDTSTLIADGTDNWVDVNLNGSGFPRGGNNFLNDGGSLYQLGGSVLADTGGDDILDGNGESPLGGVQVSLYKDLNGNGVLDAGETLIGTATTGSDGSYQFGSLVPGDYLVVETDPPGAVSDDDSQGDGTDNTVATTIVSADSTGNDFLDDSVLTAPISGTVYADTGGDDTLDGSGETPIAGVTVTLYTDPNGDGNPSDGVAVESAVTGTDGSYLFENMVPGDYVVVEVNPAGFAVSDDDTSTLIADGTDNWVDVNLDGTGTPSTGNDFLDDGGSLFTVGGQVTDGADPIPGVTITLKDGSGAVIGTAVTDSNGDYSFPNLPAGNYTIEETNPAGTTGGSDSDGGDPDLITITALAGDSLNNDFVDTGATLATIGGVVYNDTGDDDILDGNGESPVAGVTVSLYQDVDSDGIYTPGTDVLIGSTVTGSDGGYAFSNLPDGDYLAVETDPATATSDTDADGTGLNGANTVAVTLAGVDDLDNDFLDDMNTATIAGYSYADTGGDDVINGSGESPIGGTVITLYTDPNGDGDPSDGVAVAVTATGTDGSYRFDNVAPGDYVVVETQPPGFALSDDDTSTLIADGTDNWVDVNLNGSGFPRGGNNFLNDGGSLYQLGGSVLADTGGDDTLDGNGESPLGGVQVSLYKDLNGNGVLDAGETLIGTATTGSDGSYQFGSLVPGDYLVVETDPPGAVSDDDSQGDGTDNAVATTIVSADSTGNDFLDDSVLTAPISGTVYADTGGDDTLDGSGETPIAGVTLTLYTDPNGDGNPSDGVAVESAVTGTDGSYLFENMVPGDYVVVETNPGGFTVSDDDTSTLIASGTDNWVDVNLDGTGTPATGNDFLDDGGSLFTVGGQVTDGADPIPGVTITLKDGSGAVIGTAITDSNGDYSFPNLPAGNYTIEETNPTGTTGGSDSDGGDPDLITITALAGDSLNNDFVDTGATLATIGGVVYNDTGDDNLLDGNGESPVAGVTVSLYQDVNSDGIYTPGTDVLIGTAVTGTDGSYAFGNLPDGEYLAVETDPATATSDTDADGTGLNGANTVAVTLAGVDDLDNDFLDDMNTATIAGYSYADTGGDDVLNGSGESPIGGTVITLYTDPNGDGDPSDGVAVAVTATGTDGSYRFDNVAPGDYVVVETQPPGFALSDDDTSTLIADGTDNWVDVNLNGSGFPRGGNNFLNDGGSLYQLGGSVLADTGGDDTLDGNGESPLGGVQVSLYKDLNGNGVLDAGETLIGTATTGSDGSYQFGSLVPGDYLVVETDPAGAVSDDDSQGDGTDNTVATTIVSADSTGNDFLDDSVLTAPVSGTVYADTGGDDTLNGSGETPIVGVTLTLYTDPNGDGNPSDGVAVESAVTGTDGSYLFENMVPGDYVVVEVNPGGFALSDDDTSTLIASGTDNWVDVNLDGTGTPATGNDFLDDGGSIFTVGGQVTDGADPIPGVTITLKDSGGNVIGTTVTDSNGNYSFANLPAGDYTIEETNPTGTTGGSDADGGDPDLITITGLAGDSLDNDFVDTGATLADISGTVYNDTVDDNVFTGGDTPIPGVVVRVFADTNNNGLADPGEVLVGTAVTTADGTYSFTGLPEGNYVVVETDPSGTTSENDTGGSPLDNMIPVVLNGTGDKTGNDFLDDGLVPHAISGQVRDDLDADGEFSDPDRVVGGVEVRLYRDANGDGLAQPGEWVETTITDSAGNYQFNGLPDGDYLVAEIDPRGGTSTADTGPNNGDPNLIPVTLTGADSPGNDFLDAIDPAGYIYDSATGEIIPGGTVNVVQDSGPPATINLTQDGSTGQYAFEVDQPGTYTISYTPPPRYILDPNRPVSGASYDAPPGPGTDVLGSYEDAGTPGYLTDPGAVPNPYYLSFILEPGDELVINNNIPLLKLKAVNYGEFQADAGLNPGTADGQPVRDASGGGGNPDGDWSSNLLEHAFCDTPNSGVPGHQGFCVELVNAGTGQMDATFIRPEGIQDVIYTLQGADSMLGPWFTIDSIPAGAAAGGGFSAVSNGNQTETVTFADLQNDPGFAASNFGFARLCVSLDSEPDGTPDTVVLPSDGSSVEATDYTKTFGWQCVAYSDGQCASSSQPFTNKPVFSGTVDSNAAATATVDATTSAGGVDLSTLNFDPIDLDPGPGLQLVPTHYLQITSGALEGERFDIASASGGVLTLVDDPNIFTGLDPAFNPSSPTVDSLNTSDGIPADNVLAGASFQVLPHKTIDQLFDKNGAFAGLQSASDETRLLYYYDRHENPGFATISLAITGQGVKWIYQGDPDTIDQGSRPVDRCTGNYVHLLAGGTMLCGAGLVADYDLACAFNEGYNLAGAPYPLSQTANGPDGRAMVVGAAADQFHGAGTPTQASELFLWMGDQAVDDTPAPLYMEGYLTFMAADDGGSLQQWVDPNDATLADLGTDLNGPLVFKSWRAATIKMLPGNTLEPHIYPLPGTP